METLRRFRDRYLLTSAPGRALVGVYYRVSPPVADLISGSPTLRALTRLALRPAIWGARVTETSSMAMSFLLVTAVAGGLLGYLVRRARPPRTAA